MSLETPLPPAVQDPASSTGGEDGQDGWITARPPKALEVIQRIVRFPMLCAEHRDLIRTSVKRDLQARFTGTVLGWVWPLLSPLLLFAVYYFIFANLLGFKFGDELPEGQEAAFGIFMFVGVMAWAAFADSLTRGCTIVVDNGNLIKKLAFPSEILPLNVVLVSLVTTLFAVAMFVAATLVTPVWEAPGWMLVWLPVIVLLQGLFTLGLVLFLSAIQVFIRDTVQVVVVSDDDVDVPDAYLLDERAAPAREDRQLPLGRREQPDVPHHLRLARGPDVFGACARLHLGSFGTSLAVFAAWAVGVFVVGYAFFILCQRRFADEV